MTNISFDSHGTAIQAELYAPTGSPNGGMVILAHGSDGMTGPWAAMIREYAAELAALRFTALIPNYFEKTGTAPGFGAMAQIPAKLHLWQQAVNDAVIHSGTLSGVTRVGILGFSLGGHICLRLRAATKVVVEYFAPELAELGGVESASAPAPHIQIHHGLADHLVPYRNAQAIEQTLKHEGITPQVFGYEGAGHGFAGADPNNASARRSSKTRTLAFFERHL